VDPSSSTGLDTLIREMFAAPSVDPETSGHLVPGTVIDDCYRIERRVGAGGMGVVYLAQDLDLDRPVAIKLKLGATSEPQLARLWREAKMMARLSHPNVVSVYEVGTYQGMLFIAMEYLRGGTARQWLAAGARRWDEIVALYVQAGRGLAAAHAVGVVHRDFKPDNVLVGSDGAARVADFGLAQPLGTPELNVVGDGDVPSPSRSPSPADSERLTHTGTTIGTPAYMAPEQFGADVDARADQYSFCVALFEALHGRRPARPDPSGERGTVPLHIDRALRRGLAEDPQAPPLTMDALLDALEYDPARRRRWIYVGLGASGLAGLVGMVSYRAADRGFACDEGAQRIAATYDEAVRARLHDAFVASGAPDPEDSLARTLIALDAYALHWGQARDDACRATHVHGEQSTELLDRRVACLERRRGALGAAVEVLASADAAVVGRAVDVARSLPSLAPCASATTLQAEVEPAPDAIAAAVADVRALLDRSLAQQAAGQLATATASADDALREAESLGYMPVVAEALLRVASARVALGDSEAAVEPSRRAYRIALEQRQDRVALEAATQVPFLAVELPETLVWLDTADALARRLGLHDDFAASIAMKRGTAYAEEGQYEIARRELEAAIAVGTDRVVVATSRKRLANVVRFQGDRKRAKVLLEDVLATMRDIFGERHWLVAGALEDLGQLVLADGEVELGQEMLDEAIAIHRAVGGPNAPRLLSVLSTSASIAAEAGDYRRAQDLFREALDLHDRLEAAQPRGLVALLINAPPVWQRLGDEQGAIELAERGLALVVELDGDEHIRTVTSRINLASIYGNAGRRGDAEAQLLAAADALEHLEGDHRRQLLGIQLNLTQIRKGDGRLAQARASAERAAEIADAMHQAPHLDQAHVAFNLGLLLRQEDQPREAVVHFERCASVTAAVRGDNFPMRADCLYLLGRSLDDSGQDPLASYEAAATIVESGADVGTRRVATLFAVLAERVARSDRPRARRLAARAREAAEQLDADHPDRAWVLERTERLASRGP